MERFCYSCWNLYVHFLSLSLLVFIENAGIRRRRFTVTRNHELLCTGKSGRWILYRGVKLLSRWWCWCSLFLILDNGIFVGVAHIVHTGTTFLLQIWNARRRYVTCSSIRTSSSFSRPTVPKACSTWSSSSEYTHQYRMSNLRSNFQKSPEFT